MFSRINFLHSQGFPLAEAAELLLTVFPSGQPGWGPQHSGASNIMTPNSALGKSARPHSQQSEHDSKQPWCPAPLAPLWVSWSAPTPTGARAAHGGWLSVRAGTRAELQRAASSWPVTDPQASTGELAVASVLNYLLFPHREQRPGNSCLQWHHHCSPPDPV